MPIVLEDILARLPQERLDRIARLAADYEREEAEFAEPSPVAGKFVIYRDVHGAFRFQLIARNGVVVMNSESFASKKETAEAIELVRLAAAGAETVLSHV